MDYATHQRRLLPRIARSYALHFAQSELVAGLHEASMASDSDDGRRWLEAQAAGVKAVTTWHASETVQVCREACGGNGYLTENQLVGLKADNDIFTTFEGDNTVLLQLVAKEQLTGYRDEFGELDMLGTARFLADQALETLLETDVVANDGAATRRRRSVAGCPSRICSIAPGTSSCSPSVSGICWRRWRDDCAGQPRPTSRSRSSPPRRSTCSPWREPTSTGPCSRHS